MVPQNCPWFVHLHQTIHNSNGGKKVSMIGWPIVNIHTDRYKTKRQKNELRNSSPNITRVFQLKKNEKGAARSTHGSKKETQNLARISGTWSHVHVTRTFSFTLFNEKLNYSSPNIIRGTSMSLLGRGRGRRGACSINGYGTKHRQFGWNIGSLITWTVRYTLSCTFYQNLRNVPNFNNRKGQLLKISQSKFLQWHWCVTLVLLLLLLLVFFFFLRLLWPSGVFSIQQKLEMTEMHYLLHTTVHMSAYLTQSHKRSYSNS
jgi:hypothetical protein